MRLVLAGGPQFEERLASPKLESFNQRVAARCYLEALDRAQTIDYVRHQIREAGGSPDRLFTAEALAAVYQATDGIPRLVNQVCDHALLLACAGGVKQLARRRHRRSLVRLAAIAHTMERRAARRTERRRRA